MPFRGKCLKKFLRIHIKTCAQVHDDFSPSRQPYGMTERWLGWVTGLDGLINVLRRKPRRGRVA